jgi:hypothetical protein
MRRLILYGLLESENARARLDNMACRRCPGSELKGSGYCKTSNTELYRAQETALQRMLAERDSQDEKWRSAWDSSPVAATATRDTITTTTTTATTYLEPVTSAAPATIVTVEKLPATTEPLPSPVETIAHIDDNSGFYFEGHYYRYPDEQRVHALNVDLYDLAEQRRIQEDLFRAAFLAPAKTTNTEATTTAITTAITTATTTPMDEVD